MCNQAVSLVAAQLEREGITTVVIQLLREVAERMGPPRALFVPFRHGYPLGEPNNSPLQKQVMEAALGMVEDKTEQPPVLRDFAPVV